MYVRPVRPTPPKVDFSNTGQAAVLRVLDLSLFELAALPDESVPEEDRELFEEERRAQRRPIAQDWDLRLMPAAPTEFVLRCQGGKGHFDFTDLQVQELHLTADTTEVEIAFERANPVELRRFKLTATAGSVDVHRFLNARSRLATFQVAGVDCDIDLGGKPFEGEAEIFFEGKPRRIRLTVPRGVGLQVEGPSSTVGRFLGAGMQRRDRALVSDNFESQSCRLHLYFNQILPDLEVRWED
jgi:hypothetical protein